MSKITRAFQKIFGDTAPATGNFGKFGSLAAGLPQYTKDPAEIQSLDAFPLGWASATVGTKSPALQDRNALDYLAFRQIAYVLQQGIPEWNALTDYHIDGFCSYAGKIYVSKTNDNVNNLPTDTNNWIEYILKNLSKTVEKTYLFPTGAVEVLNIGTASGGWTNINLATQITSAGLTGKTIKAAIVQLYTRLGPIPFGAYNAGASLSVWSNSVTNPLACSVLLTANDSSDSAENHNTGPVPLSGTNIAYNASVFTNADYLNFKVQVLGFIYEDTL